MPWIAACASDAIDEEDVMRFDHAGASCAIDHSPDGDFFCTAGFCAHEKVHLAEGLVMDCVIECPEHNGQFDCRANLKTCPVRVERGQVPADLP